MQDIMLTENIKNITHHIFNQNNLFMIHNIQIQLKVWHHNNFILFLNLLLFINYTYFNTFYICNR